jgi:uncharacterized protein
LNTFYYHPKYPEKNSEDFMPSITQLVIYPVKSMHGVPVRQTQLTQRGLKYDRNWMVTDETQTFITQRSLPCLAAIRAGLTNDELKLESPSGDNFSIPLQASSRNKVSVEVWGDKCMALDEGDDVSEWLSDHTGGFKGKRIRLIRFDDRFRRLVDPSYLKGENAQTAFADGFPYLIASERSLNRVNERLIESGTEQVPMSRFRPNIVVNEIDAFLENSMDELYSVDKTYKFGIRKPCKRCKVTTVDQETGMIQEPHEPLRTLTRMNTVPGLHGAYFGQNATLLSGEYETIRTGDEIDFKLKSDV